MSAFLTELDTTLVDDTPRWKLLADFVYQSDLAGKITVPRGFVTDLASVPRIPLVYELFGGKANEAAVVHDWLYTCHATDRKTADAVLQEAAKVAGVSGWRAWFMWAGVRLGGASRWDA